jgi:putative spermidine/putrescine transport system ATP-binding protein
VIGIEHLERRFGEFSLSVSLAVPAGAYEVILGPSGSGKSLLLGCIAGLFTLEGGRISLDGRDVTGEPPERRGLGLVFQRSSLFPHLSVRENVEFGLRARGQRRAERRERLDELCRTLRLEPLLGRPVSALSGGEAQRVAIARALAARPRVLLLDEPLSLVDHNARLELQDELRRIHGELGLTALHVTHDREEARALGQRCAVMLGGRIVQEGPADEVFARPRCVFVAKFLGLPGAPPPAPGCSESCVGGVPRCDAPVPEAAP